MAFIVRSVPQQEIRPIRQAVLRPYQSIEECVLPGDDQPETTHFAAFDGDTMVSIASIYHEAPADEPREDAWRLRGMATLPEYRGAGFGAASLVACLKHIRALGGRLVWCNARTPAVPFYEKYGFERIGSEFDIPNIGPHYVMRLHLDSPIETHGGDV